MLNILFDTTPLNNGNAIRGVGIYTRLLSEELQKRADIHLLDSVDKTKPDLIHYPYFDLFFPTLPILRKAKTVVTIHDVIPLLYPDFYKSGVKGKLRFWRQKFALKSVAGVLTDSHASAADITKYLHVPASKIHVVYLAGNPEIQKSVQKEIDAVRKKYKLPPQYMLYVGDINYNKNLPQLIKSLKFLPDEIELVCVGKNFFPQPIPEWKMIETQIALSDVGDRVHFVTDLASDATKELSAIYSDAAVYVQPSLYEGFGLPVLEVMQCETPVVSTENSSLIEVGGKHVQFVKEDAESIANGIKEVLSWSATERQQKVKAAYEWSQTFSWSKAAEETTAVYKKVLHRK